MKLSFTMGFDDEQKPKREHKGKSMISFPEEFCAVDLETTGTNPAWDDIIEIGAIRYSGGEETGRFQTLVRPDSGYIVDDFIEELTGITNEMLADAPGIGDVLPGFMEFVGESIILGHNTNFDINFLYDNMVRHTGKPFTNDFIDTMRIARKLHPELPHHRLRDVVCYYGLTNEHEHRAETDCAATAECFARLKEEAIRQYGSEEAFAKSFDRSGRNWNVKAADIKGDVDKAIPDSPLYGKNCVITGKLYRLSRKQAMQIIADLGGVNEDRVTKKTNFLILGDMDAKQGVKGGKSAKQKTAEKYKLAGQDIEVLSEEVFLDMVSQDNN